MIAELFLILVPLLSGCALVHAEGMRGWALPAFGLIAGLAVQTLAWFVVASRLLPVPPFLVWSVVLVLPVIWWMYRWRTTQGMSISVKGSVLALVAVALTVALLWSADLVKWHTDSFNYLIVASLLSGDQLGALVPGTLEKRLLGMPALHASAGFAGELYLRSVTPLMSLSCLMVLAWFTCRGLGGRIPRAQVIAFAVLGVLVLATMNRYVWHTFYLNGHLYFGLCLLVVSGIAWLQWRGAEHDRALFVLQLLVVPVMVLMRPEGTIVAAIALVPALVNERMAWQWRAGLLFILGLSTVLWQACLGWSFHVEGRPMPGYVTPFAGLGVVAMLAAPVLAWRALWPWLRYAPGVIEGGIWAALAVAAWAKPGIFLDSVKATATNVLLDGTSWGASLALVGALVAVVLAGSRDGLRSSLRLPVTTFLPMAFLLALARDGAYRVSEADSLNRMFMHIVPLAVLLIVSAAAASWNGFPQVWKPRD